MGPWAYIVGLAYALALTAVVLAVILIRRALRERRQGEAEMVEV